MKKIKLNLTDFIEILQRLSDEGVNDIIIFENEGFPAITDADEPDTCIIFAEEGDFVPGDEEGLH